MVRQMHWNGELIKRIATIVLFVGLALWWIFYTVRRSEDPVRMIVKWIVTIIIITIMVKVVAPMVGQGGYGAAFGGIPATAVCGLALAITWRHNIAELIAQPFASLYDGGNEPPVPRPAYSVAQSRQKQGKYLEAVAEIQKQLELFPTDFEGHMMLAEIQAQNLGDMQATEATIERLCAQPGHAPINLAFALFSLADWQLQVGKDKPAAERALQQVAALLPDTEFAVTAEHRIAHLADPRAMAEMDEKIFAVPQGVKNVGLRKDMRPVAPEEKTPEQLAQEYVAHLDKYPMDAEARERLAVLYADHYGRVDLALDQLEQLVSQPNQPARVVVHCLNLMADLQLRHGADYEAIKATLERIVDRAPNLAAAENARTRITLLKLELKAKEKGQTVKMGSYDQNIGLKSVRRPPQNT